MIWYIGCASDPEYEVGNQYIGSDIHLAKDGSIFLRLDTRLCPVSDVLKFEDGEFYFFSLIDGEITWVPFNQNQRFDTPETVGGDDE